MTHDHLLRSSPMEAVLLAVFANQLCLPIPSVVVLMAAGALSAHGGMHTSIIVFCAVLGCLAGDGIWFWFGRKWGSRAIRLLCQFTSDPRNSAKKARNKFRRYGLSVLCVAKFLPGLDAAMPPLAGAEAVPLDGIPCRRCGREPPLGWFLCRAGLPVLEPTERCNLFRPTLLDRHWCRDWDSRHSLCWLPRTSSRERRCVNYECAASVPGCSHVN